MTEAHVTVHGLKPPQPLSSEGADSRAYNAQDFHVGLEAFDGPLDLLLDLAQKQQVDLLEISVLNLAKQYLAYIQQAQALKLEIAGDYLVMAAWLTYLKSRLLLPEDEAQETDDELSAEEAAEQLAWQLKRLEAMRDAAESLKDRYHLGQGRFARGERAPWQADVQYRFDWGWHDLVNSYHQLVLCKQAEANAFRPKPRQVYKVDDALMRIGKMLGLAHDWVDLRQFLPPVDDDESEENNPPIEGVSQNQARDLGLRGLSQKSHMASTFGACLELAKQGRVLIRQDKAFGPMFMRNRPQQEQAE